MDKTSLPPEGEVQPGSDGKINQIIPERYGLRCWLLLGQDRGADGMLEAPLDLAGPRPRRVLRGEARARPGPRLPRLLGAAGPGLARRRHRGVARGTTGTSLRGRGLGPRRHLMAR